MADENKDKTKDSPITFIDGRTNILLIAPHGSKEDDRNIGKLIREIAADSQCYAIINDKYIMPKNGEAVDKDDFKVDLNSITQVKEHLNDEFLDQMIKFKDSIVKEYESVIILWIHSVDDEDISKEIIDPSADVLPDDVKILVGWGQKTGDDRHTAQKETVDNLIAGLNKHGLQAVLVNPEIKDNTKKEIDYCGWDSDNMIQLFRDGEYEDGKITSILLAFRNSLLKNNKGLYPTSKSFTEVIQPDTQGTNLPVKSDTNKIEKAYNDLKNIFVEEFEQAMDNAMLNAGKYLIKTFYDDDYDKAAEKKFTQNKSLNKLFKKIQDEADGNAPKKTWLYNAIDIAIAHKKYNQLSASYGKLTHSHKIKLIQSGLEQDVQRELIDEAVNNKYTVGELQEKIKAKKNVKSTTTGIKFNLLQKSLQKKFAINELDKFEYDKLKILKKELDTIISNIRNKLEAQKPIDNKKKTKKTKEQPKAQTDEHNQDKA